MRYLIAVTILWAFSFSLIGQYLAGQVDSDFAVYEGRGRAGSRLDLCRARRQAESLS